MLRTISWMLAAVLCATSASVAHSDEQVRITPDVVYGHKNGMALVMHAYQPPVPNGAAIVEIVSGGYFSNWQPPNAKSHLVGRFLKSGYTVFSVFHGSNPKYTIPEIVGDMRLAVRFIHLHAKDYGIDPERIGVIGSSAGGHLALMLATTGDDGDKSARDEVSRMSSRVAAVVAIAAPSDLRNFDKFSEELLKNGVINKSFSELLKPAFNFDPKLAESVSPVAQVTPDDAPTMLIHGDSDSLVPIEFSHRILGPLQEKRVPCELVVLPGVGHAPTGEAMKKLAASIEGAVAWFDKYVAAPKTTATAGRDQYFDSNGVKIHYAVEGQGEPLIVIHGFMASIGLMEQQLSGVLWKMSQDYQVIAIDNRGHGKSDKPHDPAMYGVEMVNDVLRLMDHLKIKKAHIVGYSLGGFMTEYMLAHHSDRLLTATIGGMGWIKADDESMTFIVGVADSLESGKGIGPYVERMWPLGQPKPSPEQLESINQVLIEKLGNDSQALAACLRGIPRLAVTEEQLKANKVPALAIIGALDPLMISVNSLGKVMPHLKVEVIDGTDHGTAISSPKFTDSLKAFLKAESAAAAGKTQ